jgi:anti-sigma B factor antagonist
MLIGSAAQRTEAHDVVRPPVRVSARTREGTSALRLCKAATGIVEWTLSEPVVIAPEGELDIAHVGEFRDALLQVGTAAAVVVDLSSVSFIDSSGLGALVDLHNRLRREDRRLAVVAPGGTVAAVLLNLSGLQGRMPIFASREAALAA